MSDPQLKVVIEKLDYIIGLLVASVVSGKTQTEQIVALSRAGFQPKDIAEFIGTTPNAVRVCLSKMRRKK